MPAKVGQAVTLLYINIGLGFLHLIIEAQRSSHVGYFLFGGSVMLCLIWFFSYMVGKGKNWARIIFLVLFIIGIPIGLQPMLHSFATNPVSDLLLIAQTVLKVVAFVFLFQSSSSDWFRKGSRQ